jgi:hypothetical protein
VSVGVEEEEENHAEGHEVHVDQEENAPVVEAPASLHAADSVRGAGDCDQGGNDEEWSGMVAGEVGEEDGHTETDKYEETSA